MVRADCRFKEEENGSRSVHQKTYRTLTPCRWPHFSPPFSYPRRRALTFPTPPPPTTTSLYSRTIFEDLDIFFVLWRKRRELFLPPVRHTTALSHPTRGKGAQSSFQICGLAWLRFWGGPICLASRVQSSDSRIQINQQLNFASFCILLFFRVFDLPGVHI